jgi:hypothetical protein
VSEFYQLIGPNIGHSRDFIPLKALDRKQKIRNLFSHCLLGSDLPKTESWNLSRESQETPLLHDASILGFYTKPSVKPGHFNLVVPMVLFEGFVKSVYIERRFSLELSEYIKKGDLLSEDYDNLKGPLLEGFLASQFVLQMAKSAMIGNVKLSSIFPVTAVIGALGDITVGWDNSDIPLTRTPQLRDKVGPEEYAPPDIDLECSPLAEYWKGHKGTMSFSRLAGDLVTYMHQRGKGCGFQVLWPASKSKSPDLMLLVWDDHYVGLVAFQAKNYSSVVSNSMVDKWETKMWEDFQPVMQALDHELNSKGDKRTLYGHPVLVSTILPTKSRAGTFLKCKPTAEGEAADAKKPIEEIRIEATNETNDKSIAGTVRDNDFRFSRWEIGTSFKKLYANNNGMVRWKD